MTEVTYLLTVADVNRVASQWRPTRLFRAYTWAPMVTLAAGASAGAMVADDGGWGPWIAAAFVGSFVAYSAVSIALMKGYGTPDAEPLPVRMRVDGRGVCLGGDGWRSEYHWRHFHGAQETRAGLQLLLPLRHRLLIPRRATVDHGTWDDLVAFVTASVGREPAGGQ